MDTVWLRAEDVAEITGLSMETLAQSFDADYTLVQPSIQISLLILANNNVKFRIGMKHRRAIARFRGQ